MSFTPPCPLQYRPVPEGAPDAQQVLDLHDLAKSIVHNALPSPFSSVVRLGDVKKFLAAVGLEERKELSDNWGIEEELAGDVCK